MTDLTNRRAQMFPQLTAAQIAVAQRFASGPTQRFAAGETVCAVGDVGVPLWLVLEGEMQVRRRDGLGHEAPVTVERAGQFTGEVAQLAGRAVLVAATAGAQGCTALPFDAPHLRALLIGSAELGELVMRALILRRVGLIESGTAGSVLIARGGSPELLRLQGFLTRNGYPVSVLDAGSDADAAALVEKLGVGDGDLPLMLCPNGTVLRRPSEAEAGMCLGLTPRLDPAELYDVAVVGAGPAGLATAVYAASEGLSVLVLDTRATGGQAGASARIENYLGFPTGISGQALAGRASTQAQKFGAQLAIPLEVEKLDCQGKGPVRLHVKGQAAPVQARSVVIAAGARYRRPAIDNLATFEGAGVSYWASPIEAKLCSGEEVALIGGGNSAGQAAVFLSAHVRRLHLIVRGPGLEASMSRYLIDRIAALANVELHTETEVIALEGERSGGLTGAVYRHNPSGAVHRCDARHLFLFIGADPNTDWLEGCVALDAKGFVLTGEPAPDGARRLPLETDLARVFAVGDVRAGSTKRVAAAVGEGAAAVAQIHAALAAMAQ